MTLQTEIFFCQKHFNDAQFDLVIGATGLSSIPSFNVCLAIAEKCEVRCLLWSKQTTTVGWINKIEELLHDNVKYISKYKQDWIMATMWGWWMEMRKLWLHYNQRSRRSSSFNEERTSTSDQREEDDWEVFFVHVR